MSRWWRRALWSTLAVGAFLGLWACWLEPGWLVVNRVTIRLPEWPSPLSGLKVALLSDLHIGSPHWDLAALTGLVDRTNAEHPDLVLLAGDYQINDVMGGHFVEPEPIADRLSALVAPLGVVAVLGNHDWWNDGERTRRALVSHGIVVLEDDAVHLERAGAAFYVVGLADQMTRSSDARAAISHVPSGVPTILLVHEPDIFEAFGRLPFAPALTLAGHTHGGQVWLPWIGRRVVPSKYGERYAYGHIVEDGRHLFVTGGVGTSIIPVRFLVPPEVAILTLQ